MSLSVSVVVASRGRPDDLVRCVESILASTVEHFRLVVVEQLVPGRAPAPLPADPRLTHLKLDSVGKSVALNAGISLSAADFVFFTDDDCVVPEDWLARGLRIFRDRPGVGAIFSPLVAAPHDATREWVPTFEPLNDIVHAGSRAFARHRGAGANFAVRGELLDRVGPFDEQLGPGAPFPGLEEFDYFYRMLKVGARVLYDTSNPVEHWGVRNHDDGTAGRLLRGYRRGEGAVLAKHLKCGDLITLRKVGAETAAALLFALRSGLTTGRPRGLRPWWEFIRGFGAGLRRPVDRRTRLFDPPGHLPSIPS